MHARLWLALACVSGALLLWWIAGGAEGSARVEAHAPRALQEAPREASELRAPAEPVEIASARSAVAPETLAENEADPERRRAFGAGRGPVIVRVQLALASGGEHSFASWRVEAQSWIEETNATFPHEARANAAGVAEFRFPGFVHIDWLRCVPPPESGLAMAFAEHHVDLDAGESLEETLELAPGGLLGARVVDSHGEPVTGANVHAYADGFGWDILEWQPGIAQSSSGPDGSVELPPLPPGDWGLFVKPEAWLQIEPGPYDERSLPALTAGSRVDAGTLRVARIHRFRLQVLDAFDRAVPEAAVSLEPLDLAAHGMVTREPDEPGSLDLFLEHASLPVPGNEPPPLWPYGELAWTTDARGEAAPLGIAGTWRLTVMPRLARSKDDAAAVRCELTLPCADRTVRVPSVLVELGGSVVDVEAQPVPGTQLRLKRSANENLASTQSESNGSFALRGLLPGSEYLLEASHPEYVPAAKPVRVTADAEPTRFELRRAGALRLAFVDTAGAPVKQKEISIVSTTPDEPLRPAESAWVAEHPRRSRSTSDTGRVEFVQLPPGKVELGLLMPFASSAVDAFGNRVVTRDVHQRWTVRVQAGEQQLVVDLSSYAPPVPSRQPWHRGVVVDARSGAPIAGASVCSRSARGRHQSFTATDGRFQLPALVGAHSLSVLKPGYLRLDVPEREWSTGQNEHSFALEPGGIELGLEFVDRDGMRLPRVDVGVTDEEGRPVLAWVQAFGKGFATNGQPVSTDGRLKLSSIAPSRLLFPLSVEGHELGSCSFEPGAGPAPQTATLQLDRTLAEMRRAIERALEED